MSSNSTLGGASGGASTAIISSTSPGKAAASSSSSSTSKTTTSAAAAASWLVSPGGAMGSSKSSTSTSSSTSGSNELDERVVAKAALDAAEDALESLCAVHAGTFVAVEKRSQRMEQALKELQASIDKVQKQVQVAQDAVAAAQSEEKTPQGDDTNNNTSDDCQEHSLFILSEMHRVRRRTLLQHSALLELLELPSLMDACVRSNLYEEALSIASLANTLERRRHGDGTGGGTAASGGGDLVVGHVVTQIRSRQDDLRRHLLHRLEGSVTMPDCLEVVTALRRLNSIDLERKTTTRRTTKSSSTKTPAVTPPPQEEQEASSAPETELMYRAMEVKLQIDFLEARNHWLDNHHQRLSSNSGLASSSATAADAASTTTTPKYSSLTASSASTATVAAAAASAEDMLDTIERYRTRVFEVATQFNAIFRANSSLMGAIESSSSLSAGDDEKTGGDITSADLLSLWACRRIHAFLQILQAGIQTAAAASAAEVVQGSMSAATAAAAGTSGSSYPYGSATGNYHHQTSTTAAQQFGAATLRDWLEATLFFAGSMGRLGADFTSHNIPIIFENALVDWIVHHCWLQQGVKPLQEVWNVCHQANLATPLVATRGTSSSSSSSSSSSGYATSIVAWSQSNPEVLETLFQDFVVPDTPEQVLEQPVGPLRILMQVPPLGRFVNAILYGLNELRRCLLPSAFPRLISALEDEILQPLTKDLKQLERLLVTTPNRDRVLREVIINEYMPLWNHVVIPYCRGSLWTAMGRGRLALAEYQAARRAIDELIGEKKKVVEDALQLEREKQRKEEEEEAARSVEQEAQTRPDAAAAVEDTEGDGHHAVGDGEDEGAFDAEKD